LLEPFAYVLLRSSEGSSSGNQNASCPAGGRGSPTRLLSRKAILAECAIRHFKNGRIESSPVLSENLMPSMIAKQRIRN
jgi:hypothetical protein